MADRYGYLDGRVKEFAPTAKEHRELAEQIRGLHADTPAEQPAVIAGSAYKILVGECGEERKIGEKAKSTIYRLIGRARAMSVFSLTLKAAEAEIGATKLESLVTTERTGARKLVAVAIVAAESAKAA